MLLKRKYGWDLAERSTTDEKTFFERRKFVNAIGLFGASMGFGIFSKSNTCMANIDVTSKSNLYPVTRNLKYAVKRPVTKEGLVTRYNNFYEFGSHKNIAPAAQAMRIEPWEIRIDGEVEEVIKIDIDGLLRQVQLEERVYRFRCVEAWSMIVPWSGFPLRTLLNLAKPTSDARYLRMETIADDAYMPGVRQTWYEWPYVECLTMAEAANELSFIATGIYGKPIPKQNGAPLRLVVPWKYGFKSIKSITRFTFVRDRPMTFWERAQGGEYGFWANVNPSVAHPRWSQATEQPLGRANREPTVLYNGYGDFVASLYTGLRRKLGAKLYR